MYNILARISDFYPMKKEFSNGETIIYSGPWEPYVRDFDPTLNANNLLNPNAPIFSQVYDHIREAIQENEKRKNALDFDECEWTKEETVFFEHQKQDLFLTDFDGNQWIVLSKYADTGRNNLAQDRLLIWNRLYGYFVSEEQLIILKTYAYKKINMLNYDITKIPETYTVYNREYPWAAVNTSILEWQYRNISLQTEQIITILNATQDLIWEEEYDASKEETISYSHPCAELISTLGLRQIVYDGYYYDDKGILVAFDTDLTNQKVGLVIRKSYLDDFLNRKKLHLIWFVNASKEIHDETLANINYADWTGILEYTGDSVEGEYYTVKGR